MGQSEVKVLKIDYELGGRKSIHPAILCDDSDRILADCGYPGFLPMLERASAAAGVPLGELTGIVITHHDYDHYGALREIVEKYPHIRAMSSEFDAPYIEGKKPPLRVSLGKEIFASLSGEMREEARRFRAKLESVKPVKIDRVFRGGEVTPWCGGTEIISTPGHMPGHISLYVRPLKTLITGDALIALRGKLRTPNPQYATDAEEAKKTAAALLAMDVEKFVCYHGGAVTRNGDALVFER
ncbi:MAG: MBL fold metallo-hydrolase [Synergistaceae bacterium]|jgi:glyoxylase-like metal-dependent hydrolase (beta-lactamase superfamily II)|nr:MBL fold metallo-hydrolase [Synergistaceae bacterium]